MSDAIRKLIESWLAPTKPKNHDGAVRAIERRKCAAELEAALASALIARWEAHWYRREETQTIEAALPVPASTCLRAESAAELEALIARWEARTSEQIGLYATELLAELKALKAGLL